MPTNEHLRQPQLFNDGRHLFWEQRRVKCASEVPEYEEMLLKEFLLTESERTGLGITGIYKRIHRGFYPDLTIRKVSPKRIFVSMIKIQPG